MKEIKILAIIVVIVGVLYWGVEPLAHATFHPEVAKADFEFKDLQDIDLSKGDATRGKEIVETNCVACHTLNDAGIAGADMTMYFRDNKEATIFTPDISTAGAIYDGKFLANLIIDPVNALHLAHKFPNGDFPMTQYFGLEDTNQEVADIVAYLKSVGSISLKKQVLESEEFIAKKEAIEKTELSNEQKQTEIASLDVYLGSTAPDLSMMIRSKGKHYLEYFINDPQKVSFKAIQDAIIQKEGTLPPNDKKSPWQDDRDYSNLAKELGVMPVGLSMPRVGLTEEAQERVVAYLESIGDAKKEQRETLGIYLMIFFGIMSVLAYLWKKRIWSEVH